MRNYSRKNDTEGEKLLEENKSVKYSRKEKIDGKRKPWNG